MGDFIKRDYVLEMYVEYMPKKHPVKRTVRVSGGLNLAVLSDKVIKPLFGLFVCITTLTHLLILIMVLVYATCTHIPSQTSRMAPYLAQR